jgi:hypothetical protein
MIDPFSMAQQPVVGPGLLIIEASRSHSFVHTTLSRTPLDEWSAQRRDLYLTTHNIVKRQTSMTPAGFFFFFACPGFFPFDPFLYCFKSLRPSCQFTFHYTDLTTNTTQTSMPPVGFFFFFFACPGFVPFDPFLYCFKSFRPSCHFTFHITVLTTNTTQTSMPPVGFFFFFSCLGFFPFDPFLYCLNPFRPSCHFTFHSTVLTTNTTQTSMPPVGFETTILVSERP